MSQSEMPIDIKLASVRKQLEIKSTLSSWTKNENSLVDKAMDTITSVEKYNE